MKLNKYVSTLVSELIRSEKVIDQNAESISDVCEATGLKRRTAEISVAAKFKSGLIEQVWKQQNGRMVKAYRIKKPSKARV